MGLEDFLETVVKLEPANSTNGSWVYVNGDTYSAGFILNQSREARAMESIDLRDSYTIVMYPTGEITHGDIILRLRDGARYRITSDFAHTPDIAAESLMQASAQKLPPEGGFSP
ncbi:MAG: hypothetical protein FWE24_09120 [Defluviitaleaceae bacterium]|nr:hypothetical protein [Defluviitaleaceae bacterium]